MSSNYRLLCLGHDPAIVIDREWDNYPDHAVAAASDPAGRGLFDHKDCDLVIGRWSGSLAEIGCPPSTPMTADHLISHPHDAVWVGVGWLRLLAAAGAASSDADTELAAAVAEASRCWSIERASRLRVQLGLDEAPDAEPFFEPGHTYRSANGYNSFHCERIIDGMAIGRETALQGHHDYRPANCGLNVWKSVRAEGCWTDLADSE